MKNIYHYGVNILKRYILAACGISLFSTAMIRLDEPVVKRMYTEICAMQEAAHKANITRGAASVYTEWAHYSHRLFTNRGSLDLAAGLCSQLQKEAQYKLLLRQAKTSNAKEDWNQWRTYSVDYIQTFLRQRYHIVFPGQTTNDSRVEFLKANEQLPFANKIAIKVGVLCFFGLQQIHRNALKEKANVSF